MTLASRWVQGAELILLVLRNLVGDVPEHRCSATRLLADRVFTAPHVPSFWSSTTDDVSVVPLREGTDGDVLAALRQCLVPSDVTQLGIGADARGWPAEWPLAQRRLEMASMLGA